MLLAMLSERLKDSPVDGLIVTTPSLECRIKLGAQIVKSLVQGGFVGGVEKWQNIILCGTKADMAQEDHLEYFESDVTEQFFSQAEQRGIGPYCLVGKVDDLDADPPQWCREKNAKIYTKVQSCSSRLHCSQCVVHP